MKLKKRTLTIFFIFLILITGIRYFNGVDYGTYTSIFRGIGTINDYSYLEILFRIIVVFNNKFLNYNYNFIMCSILNFIFLYFALKKIKYPFLGLFVYINLFWINYSFNGIRQGIAMNIFLLALFSSTLNFFILGLISIGFHKISIFIFFISKIIFMIKNIKINRITLTIISILFVAFSEKVVYFLSFYIPKLVNYSIKYKGFSIKGLIFRVITIIIFLYFEKEIKKDYFYQKIFKLYIFSFLEYLLFFNSYMFGTRINMFFRIIEIILYSKIFCILKNKKKKLILILLLSIFWSSIYYKELISKYNSPYKINPYFNIKNKLYIKI